MNLYVGNLDFKVSEAELKGLFEGYGAVSSVKIITDKFSGKSKGFGFVTMDNEAEAAKAMQELNGSPYKSRDLIVNEAKPRKTNSAG